MNDLAPGGFLCAHVTHPDALMALALVAAQLEAQRAQRPEFQPTLALVYFTSALAPQAEALLAEMGQRWPGLHVAGSEGQGVVVSGVEYVNEPALVVMLLDLEPWSFHVFNGRQPLAGEWEDRTWAALVHADPSTPELGELTGELCERTGAHDLFGGVSSGRGRTVQLADGVFSGGLSGVAFSAEVDLISRVTQGCQPIGPTRTVTACERNLVLTLDGEPALPQLLADLHLDLEPHEPLMRELRITLAGLTDEGDQARDQGGQLGVDTRVRRLIGLDPNRDAVAVADWVSPGMQLGFCQRHAEAARRDLVRICAEIREEAAGDDDAGIAPRRLAGAVYVSCTGRSGAYFGGPSAEMQIVRHALGDVPLVGFFAAGEIAGRHLYSYTGVLTVFLVDPL